MSSSEYFESALASLLKPQEKDRLIKILLVIKKNVRWPLNKVNIISLCNKGGLIPLIACLEHNCVPLVTTALSILGNCCMEPDCARIAVKRHNLIPCLNRTLHAFKHDSIYGRVFQIVVNLCQHKDRYGSFILQQETHLQFISKINLYFEFIVNAQDDEYTNATIIMGMRLFRELVNLETSEFLLCMGVLQSAGLVLIKFTPLWLQTKMHEDVLEVTLRMIYDYSRYKCTTTITQLQNTPIGNALPYLGNVLFLAPFRIVKIITRLIKLSNHKSDLPIIDISNSLLEKLKNPQSFEEGYEDILYREYLKCLCWLIQYPNIRQIMDNANVIPVLLEVLRLYDKPTVIAFKNLTTIISILRLYVNTQNNFVKTILHKYGIFNILTSKLRLVEDALNDIDFKHEDGSITYRLQRRQRKTYDNHKDYYMNTFTNENFFFKRSSRTLYYSPRSETSFSSEPSCSPLSSPIETESDDDFSENYSPVCSDNEQSVIIFKDCKIQSYGLETVVNEPTFRTTRECANLSLKQELVTEIMKLIRVLIKIRAPPIEFLSSLDLLTKLLQITLPWNQHIRDFHPVEILNIISRIPEYFVGVAQTDFIFFVYKLMDMEHGLCCPVCKHLEAVGSMLMKNFKKIMDDMCGKGDIAHSLFRGSLQLKQKLVTSIPFLTDNTVILNKLMKTCGGLEIMLQLIKDNPNLNEKLIIGLCLLAKKLKIKDPTIFYQAVPFYVIDVTPESYMVDDNCSSVMYFKLDDGSCVPANRKSLRDYSDYFNCLLYGQFKESLQEEVNIPNVSEQALKFLLKLLQLKIDQNKLYSFCVDINLMLEVIALADRFLLDDLSVCLTKSVERFFTFENIPTIYQWSLVSGTDILRIEAIAHALVGHMHIAERFELFQNLFKLGYTEHVVSDIQNLLERSFSLS